MNPYETVHQVNREALVAKLEQMGITGRHKYREAHAITAVEEFAVSSALEQESKSSPSLVLTPSEVAYILLAWSENQNPLPPIHSGLVRTPKGQGVILDTTPTISGGGYLYKVALDTGIGFEWFRACDLDPVEAT